MEISWNFTYAERDLSSPKTTVPILVDAVTESARAYSYSRGRKPGEDGRTSNRCCRATEAALADEGAKGVMLVDSPPHQPHKKEKKYTISACRYRKHINFVF